MASFNPNIDLLAIPGAKPMTFNEGTAENPKMVNYICIPASLNEIEIAPSRADHNELTAYMRLAMRPFSQNYISRVVAEKQRRGDAVDMSRIESHEVTLSHGKEFVDAWKNAVAAAVLKEHPEWQGQSLDEGSKTDLYYEVRRRINKRIGKAYPIVSQQQPQAPAAPQTFGAPMMPPPAFVPDCAGAGMAAGEMQVGDDLPF